MVGEIPPVTEIEAGDDRAWFACHLQRRFRARPGAGGWWLVRRRGAVLLRTFSSTALALADRDKAIAPAWFAAAYPDEFFERAKRKGRKALAIGGRR